MEDGEENARRQCLTGARVMRDWEREKGLAGEEQSR
jgi:hypothetical protein